MYQKEIKTYRKHLHLKLAAEELGIPLPTLYWRLKKAGEPVIGNKKEHGGESDKIAAIGEDRFKKLISFAEDNNANEFQSKVDFTVNGYKVEVKTARLKGGGRGNKRWAFSLKKQEKIADFFICYALNNDLTTNRILFIPADIVKTYQTLSLSLNKSKWNDFAVSESDLIEFFNLDRQA